MTRQNKARADERPAETTHFERRETPAIEVSTAGRSEPAVLTLRERALSLREAVGSVGASPEALARARDLVNRAVAVALGKD